MWYLFIRPTSLTFELKIRFNIKIVHNLVIVGFNDSAHRWWWDDCRSGSLPEMLQYRVWPVSRTETFNTQYPKGDIQCRPLISAACTLRSRCVHAAFSVAHFLKYQSERSVNAAFTQGARSVNAQWTQNARRPRSVWTLRGHRANTGQARSRHSQPGSERRLDADQTHTEPGSALDTGTSHQSYLCTWSAFKPEIQLKFFAWSRGITTV